MKDRGYGTGIKHLLEQAEQGNSCILTQPQTMEVAGTLVELASQLEAVEFATEAQSNFFTWLKENHFDEESWEQVVGEWPPIGDALGNGETQEST